jgi:DNA topoisomerase-1
MTKDQETIWDCPQCPKGKLIRRLSKSGQFLGCTEYPGCTYTQPLEAEEGLEGD